ncbi:MAG: AraC family transcriptional regulator [Gemmatimonadales bacterium]
MTESATAARAAAWYGEGRPQSSPPARPRGNGRGPRALEARGFASVHHILVQLADAGLRPRFAEYCRAFGDIAWCDDPDDLVVRSESRHALGVVVDVADRWNGRTTAAVAKIRAARPALPIVLWCDRQVPAGALADLARAGVSAVVFRDESELEERLLSALTRATDVTFQQLTDQALARRVPEALVPVVRFVLDRAAAKPTAALVARAMGLTARQLAAELKRGGMPPVSVLVRWSRLLTAAYRLERSTEPIAAVARSVGFPTTAALGRLFRIHANETVRGVREPGGFGWVLRCFERALAKSNQGKRGG